jgi:hypothetical protein
MGSSPIRGTLINKNMDSFTSFITERVYEITDEEEKQINDLVKKYKDLFFKDRKTSLKISYETPEVYFKDQLDETGENLFLGTINYIDLQDKETKSTNIFVSFERDASSRGEFYDEYGEIYLYYYNLEFKEKLIKDILTHELLHAKQHYKKMSKSYKEAIRKRKKPSGEYGLRSYRKYYYDPLELPVYTTLLVRDFLSEYRESNRLEKYMLKNFLAGFIKRGAEVRESDSIVPEFILDRRDFLKFIFLNRKHKKYRQAYKDFIKKLYWTYNKMV